jgi:diguanylate cyclase
MLSVLIDLMFATATASGGTVAGWWLRRHFRDANRAREDVRTAREVLVGLQNLATHMAADMGQHTSRVEKINEELTVADVRNPGTVVSAVTKLIQTNKQMQQQISSAETKLLEQAKLVEAQAAAARTDALTGVANRRAFDDALARSIDEFTRLKKPFALIMGDIDHFKRFNDEHGHQTGDGVLRGVAGALRTGAGGQGIVARYGGEEFTVILPELTGEKAAQCLERLRRGIADARFRILGKDFHVTMSLGVADMLPGDDATTLIHRADAALYASKEAGRNRGHLHDGHSIRSIPQSDAPPVRDSAAVQHANRQQGKPLCNRNDFCLTLGRRLAEWRRGGPLPGVLLVRIDHFGEIAERYGTEVSSLMLRSTAQFLDASIREMDVGGQYEVGTFAMLLPGVAPADLIGIGRRLRESVLRCILPIQGVTLQFTISVAGAVAVRSEGTQMLLERLEETLERAAGVGGNCVYFHDGRQALSAEAIAAPAAPD